jgi:hypothetical protein
LSWEVVVIEMKEHGNDCDRDWSKLVGFKKGLDATKNSVRLGFRKWNGQLQFTPYLRVDGEIKSGDRSGYPVWDVEEGKTYVVNMTIGDGLIMEVEGVGTFAADVEYNRVIETNLYLGGDCPGEVKAQTCLID